MSTPAPIVAAENFIQNFIDKDVSVIAARKALFDAAKALEVAAATATKLAVEAAIRQIPFVGGAVETAIAPTLDAVESKVNAAAAGAIDREEATLEAASTKPAPVAAPTASVASGS